MHIIFTPFPFLFFIVSQENMAAVHTCFVPLARLSSLEVVSHTGRREVEVSECTSLPGRGSLWVLEGGEGSSMCWPVHGCGLRTVLYRACGVRLL